MKMPPASLTGVTLLIAVAGCAGEAGVEAATVLEYNQCQGVAPGVTRVDYAAVAAIRGNTLLRLDTPEQPAADAAPPAGAGAAEPTGPDNGQSPGDPLLVSISRGPQPTPGYALALEGVHRRDDTAVITVQWSTPDPASMQAQVITHPCLVVALPGGGHFSRVEAVDQEGQSLGSLDLQ